MRVRRREGQEEKVEAHENEKLESNFWLSIYTVSYLEQRVKNQNGLSFRETSDAMYSSPGRSNHYLINGLPCNNEA